MLIDRHLAAPDVRSRHEVEVNATPERVWAAIDALDPASSPVVRVLMALRSLPARLTRRAARPPRTLRGGFVLLDQALGDEIVLGLVGRFWSPAGGLLRVEPSAFAGFDLPGYAVAACNVTVRGDGPVRLATETRVRCTDDAARRRFRAYWALVGPFSGLIRRDMLRAIRRAAERA